MKIALTSDLHLTSRSHHPERYRALEAILTDLVDQDIRRLIIAGDLFDSSLKNYSDFEALCGRETFKGIEIHIIPGNHDSDLHGDAITAGNVHIAARAQILEPGGILLLPYAEKKTMGAEIETYAERLAAMKKWILVGHGDWSRGLKDPNPYEPGIYMPLTPRDVLRYQPVRVFLGHLHAASGDDRVHIMGSPCGLDITETGRRRYLVYDIESDQLESRIVNTDILFFNETFVTFPFEDEIERMEREISNRILSWNLGDSEAEKVRVRVTVKGYSSDRRALLAAVDGAFSDFSLYKDEKPDLSQVLLSDDLELQNLSERVAGEIESLGESENPDDPSREQVLIAALGVIYGE